MTTFFILVISFFALMGAPIFAAFLAFAALGASSIHTNVHQTLIQAFGGTLIKVQALATGDAATSLSTIPLFTFTGYIMAESGTAQRLVDFAKAWVGWLPGGLAIVSIFTCALFTTFTGASGVTIVAIGSMILPALIKDGYKERFSLGLVAGTGSVGLLFPPALPLIVYGIVYGLAAQSAAGASGDSLTLIDFSVDKFMLAGILPGLVLVLSLCGFAMYHAIRNKVPTTKFEGKRALHAGAKAAPELIIPLLVIVSMATGWLQIPEAAAVTSLYVLIIEMALFRDVKLKDLPKIARSSMGLVGAIFMVIVSATALTDYFINANVPDKLYAMMQASITHRWAFLLGLNVMLLIVGCVMDIFSAIVVVVPLIAPAAAHYHIDPYHLGVIFLLNLEVGYLHPPVGLNLIITGYHFRKPMAETVMAVLPFLGLMIGVLLLVTYVEQLVPIKSKSTTQKTPAAEVVVDAGPVQSIQLDDGGVLTTAKCEAMEDELDKADCLAMFKLYDRCSQFTEELDKVECQQNVLSGQNPFEVDGGDGAGGEADAGPAAAVDAGQ